MAAITSAVVGLGTAVYGASQAKKQQKKQEKLARESIEAADPFRKYRPKYAEDLSKLMDDPSSIENTPEYKARMQAAERQVAAQGYAGSGNAILEAANAGGAAFEQAYRRLAELSGASATPGGGYSSALAANQASGDNYLSSIVGVGNNLGYLAGKMFNRSAPPAAPSSGSATLGRGGPPV